MLITESTGENFNPVISLIVLDSLVVADVIIFSVLFGISFMHDSSCLLNSQLGLHHDRCFFTEIVTIIFFRPLGES